MFAYLEQHVKLKEAWKKCILPKELLAHSFAFIPTFKSKLVAKKDQLLFVNGNFEPTLSHVPEKIVALPQDLAKRSFGTYLQDRLQEALEKETDPFALLNLALHDRGLFLYIPSHIKTTLQLLHIITEKNALAFPRLHIALGKGADLKLISSSQAEENAFCSSVVDITMDEGAKLEMIAHYPQREAIRAHLKKDALFQHISISSGGWQDFSIELKGENATAHLEGAWKCTGKSEVHTHVLMDHMAPHTHSMQHFKGILSDLSRSYFEGKIHVRKEAQKTQAYQLNHNLILGEYAQATSRPNLEIFADDVKASHGATVTQLDPKQLFYLQTRGISQTIAKELLTQGFLQDILAKI